MESCGMDFIKYLMFIFNSIFAISGLGIIVAGAIVLADVGEYNQFMESRMMALPVVLIVAGAIVFIVAFLGCFGAIRESYSMLMAFAVCMMIIFIMELAVGIAAAVYKNDLEYALKNSLRNSMKNYSISETERTAWDKVQMKLQCCGVDSPNDWSGQSTPYSCCQPYQEYNELPSPYCVASRQNRNYLRSTGCYSKLVQKSVSGVKVLIGVGIGIAFVEVIGIVLACWLASTIKKESEK